VFKVCATTAYIAGFGTAGSLLAGAAILLVLASAVVSFNRLAAGRAISRLRLRSSSRAPCASRREHFQSPVTAVAAARAAAAAAVTAAPTASASGRATAGNRKRRSRWRHRAGNTGAVGGTVSSSGSSLASSVTGVTAPVASGLGTINSTLGGTLRSAGQQARKHLDECDERGVGDAEFGGLGAAWPARRQDQVAATLGASNRMRGGWSTSA
jgi:hypothetical protein